MPKTVSGPPYLCSQAELRVEEVMAHSILVDDIINVAHCLIVLYPSAVCEIQLSLFEQLLHLIFLISCEVVIPIFEKDHFGNEVFAGSVANKGIEHGVEDGLGVALVHSIEKTSRAEVNVLEVVIRIKPEGIQMRMEGHEKLLSIPRTVSPDRRE